MPEIPQAQCSAYPSNPMAKLGHQSQRTHIMAEQQMLSAHGVMVSIEVCPHDVGFFKIFV